MATKKAKQLPLWLDDMAKKYWKQFASDVNIEDRFLYESLAHYCSFASEYRRANDEILKDGMTIRTSTSIKPHPALSIKNQAMTHMQRLSKVLFSPDKDAGAIQHDDLTNFFEG